MPFDTTAKVSRQRTFLPRRNTLVLDNAEGTILSVESGVLWITLERDPRDIILLPGMRFEIDRTGKTVVVAEEDSRLRVLGNAFGGGSRGQVGAQNRLQVASRLVMPDVAPEGGVLLIRLGAPTELPSEAFGRQRLSNTIAPFFSAT